MRLWKKILFTGLTALFCLTVFCGLAYGYFRFVPPAGKVLVGKSESQIPYEKKPQNTGVFCRLPDDTPLYFYLDFAASRLTVEKTSVFADDPATLCCSLDIERLIDLIDRVGGLEWRTGTDLMRLAGVQATDLFENDPSLETRQKLLTAFIRAVARYGLDNDDLQMLFGESNFARFESWYEYLPQVFAGYRP